MKRIKPEQLLEHLQDERENLRREHCDIALKAALELRKPTAAEQQRMNQLWIKIALLNAKIAELDGGNN